MPVASELGYVPASLADDTTVREAKLVELRRFADVKEHAGVPIETAFRQGDACFEICEAARETGADLIVMGTHGRSGFKRLALGSVTESVLRDAPAPVLTVHRDVARHTGLFGRIVCATDVSERTVGTIAVALALADEGAKRLTLLNVIEDGKESMRGDLERAAHAALTKLIPENARNSYVIENHIAFGQADREILKVAAREHADLIVMGAHTHAVLGGLFGSTVHGVVREAGCPVLLVPTAHVWAPTAVETFQLA
jgi:nucleotide-binding universal stress UspA family protein